MDAITNHIKKEVISELKNPQAEFASGANAFAYKFDVSRVEEKFKAELLKMKTEMRVDLDRTSKNLNDCQYELKAHEKILASQDDSMQNYATTAG